MRKRKLVTLDLEKEFEWEIPSDDENEKPIKFYYKALSNRESSHFDSELVLYTNDSATIKEPEINYKVVLAKVTKIENLFLDGKEVNLTDEKEIKSFIENTMPKEWINELAGHIRIMSEFSKEDIEALKKP